jgi:hypothetical protein
MLLLAALAAGFASGIVELDEYSYESHTRQPDKYNVIMFYNTGTLFILRTASDSVLTDQRRAQFRDQMACRLRKL